MNPQLKTSNPRNHFNDFRTFGETINSRRYSLGDGSPRYSNQQNFLYYRALYGLKMYSPEEIKTMHKQKRKRIAKVQQRTQNVLNIWKQTKLLQFTKSVFSLFPNSKLVTGIMEAYQEPDPTFVCNSSFKELGITKEDVVAKLLEEGLLPKNFYQLTNASCQETL
jgi:hypothetical protein